MTAKVDGMIVSIGADDLVSTIYERLINQVRERGGQPESDIYTDDGVLSFVWSTEFTPEQMEDEWRMLISSTLVANIMPDVIDVPMLCDMDKDVEYEPDDRRFTFRYNWPQFVDTTWATDKRIQTAIRLLAEFVPESGSLVDQALNQLRAIE